MGWLRTLVVLACCLGVVGCSDDSPGPEPGPSPTGSVSTPMPSFSSSAPEPAPTEPALPGAAKEATERGARAFIAYYWDLINYAQVTGDVRALKRVSAPGCRGCAEGTVGIENVYSDGGHVEGGIYSTEVLQINSLDGPVKLFEALLKVDNTAQLTVNGDGTEHRSKASSVQVSMAVSWTDGAWRTEVADPK